MHNVKLITITPDAEKSIVYMARVSNPSNQKNEETSTRLIKYLIKHRHWSPFEMAHMSVEINTSRAIAAQILRHRSFSFQEFCLAGDSRITVSTPGGSVQRLPIEELHRLWSSGLFKARMARAYDANLGRFIEAPIKSVYSSGRKPVYEFTIKSSASHRRIRCTREHRVLTKERGFVPFGEAFDSGLNVALNGAPADALMYRNPTVLEENAWMGSTAFAAKYNIADVTARKWFRHYGMTPSRPNNAPSSGVDQGFSGKLSSFMKWARQNVRKEQCQDCGHDGSTSRLELSHTVAHDGDPKLAFDESNLRTLCARCHRKHDQLIQGKQYGWTLGMTAKWGRIQSQVFLGIQDTYDIEMDHPTHNFVADGVVVHNSQRYSSVEDLTPLEMPMLRRQDVKNKQASHDDLDPELKKELMAAIADHYENTQSLYLRLLGEGVAKECAREVLPLGTPTRIYMAGSIRSWIHYLEVRCGVETQLEHRMVANNIRDIFKEYLPSIYESVWVQ